MRSCLFKTVCTLLLAAIPFLAQATALDQLKNFSTNARSARGEFSQAQVKTGEKIRFTNTTSGKSTLISSSFIFRAKESFFQSSFPYCHFDKSIRVFAFK